VTGVLIAPEGTLGAKKLELLKLAVASARRIAVLEAEDPAAGRVQMPELQKAAIALGLDLRLISVRNRDIGDAFTRMVATRPDALFVLADTHFWSGRRPVIARTLQHRLPSMWEWREQVQDGGLMSYGTSLVARWEQVASHVDRILKGANPGEMPVDQPAHLGLALNLATAKAIGLEIPQSLVLRADEVIR
jgi:putative ABC transport system substrate-binding protein